MGIVIALLDIVQMLLWVLSIVIIAQAVFSWLVVFNVVNTRSDFVRTVWTALEKITEPLYRPIRRIMPDFGGIDFSPIVVLLLIWVISRLLGGVELDLQRSYYMGQGPHGSSTERQRQPTFGAGSPTLPRRSARKRDARRVLPLSWSANT